MKNIFRCIFSHALLTTAVFATPADIPEAWRYVHPDARIQPSRNQMLFRTDEFLWLYSENEMLKLTPNGQLSSSAKVNFDEVLRNDDGWLGRRGDVITVLNAQLQPVATQNINTERFCPPKSDCFVHYHRLLIAGTDWIVFGTIAGLAFEIRSEIAGSEKYAVTSKISWRSEPENHALVSSTDTVSAFTVRGGKDVGRIRVVRRDAGGTEVWNSHWEKVSDFVDPSGIAVTRTGEIYVAVQYGDAAKRVWGNSLLKFDTQGKLLWNHTLSTDLSSVALLLLGDESVLVQRSGFSGKGHVERFLTDGTRSWGLDFDGDATSVLLDGERAFYLSVREGIWKVSNTDGTILLRAQHRNPSIIVGGPIDTRSMALAGNSLFVAGVTRSSRKFFNCGTKTPNKCPMKETAIVRFDLP